MTQPPEKPDIAEAFARLQQAYADNPAAPPTAPGEISPLALRAAEALLFASGQAIPAAALAEKLGPGVDVARVLMALKKHYAGRGVELVEAGGGWRFQTAPDLADLFVEARAQPKKLPKAALETLAVIAYHQPVTRAEIEDIRGVSLSKGSLDLLVEIGWVRPRGRRRTPGRPLTFGTTDAFLAQFGLTALDALPGKDDLKALGLLDPRAAAQIEVPRPDAAALDEEPLSPDEDGAAFFVDHLDGRGDV